jgi:hypothetical protein
MLRSMRGVSALYAMLGDRWFDVIKATVLGASRRTPFSSPPFSSIWLNLA